MRIAFLTLSGRGLIDDCLAEAVADLEERGFRVAGTVRVLPADPRSHACDMDVRVVPDGPSLRISQPLGPVSRGCRLDAEVIETLALAVERRVQAADLLVINKFGKQEAAGRGMRQAIILAVEAGIPVVVGVNEMNVPDFLTFAGYQAERLAGTPEAVVSWAAARRLTVADA